jgi:hypothetical protein
MIPQFFSPVARVPSGVFNLIRLRYPNEFFDCLMNLLSEKSAVQKIKSPKQQIYSTVAVFAISPNLPT